MHPGAAAPPRPLQPSQLVALAVFLCTVMAKEDSKASPPALLPLERQFSPGTCGTVWGHLTVTTGGRGCCCHLGERGQGCCPAFCNAQDNSRPKNACSGHKHHSAQAERLERYPFSPFLSSPMADSGRTWARIGSNWCQLFLDNYDFLHRFLSIKALCFLESNKCI